MPKKTKQTYTVLNDYNDIVKYLQEQKQRHQKEQLIILSILGTALGLTMVILYIVWKGY